MIQQYKGTVAIQSERYNAWVSAVLCAQGDTTEMS